EVAGRDIAVAAADAEAAIAARDRAGRHDTVAPIDSRGEIAHDIGGIAIGEEGKWAAEGLVRAQVDRARPNDRERVCIRYGDVAAKDGLAVIGSAVECDCRREAALIRISVVAR